MSLDSGTLRVGSESIARKGLLAALVVALLLVACAPPVTRPPETATARPEGFPEQYYREALGRGQRVFAVEPERSLVVIEVRRGGSLARSGA